MSKVEVDIVFRPMFFNKFGFWLGVTRLVPSVRALNTYPRWIDYAPEKPFFLSDPRANSLGDQVFDERSRS